MIMSMPKYCLSMQKYMNKLRNIVLLVLPILLVLLQLHSYGQGKQANMWYFGYYAGVDFNQGSPPAALTNSQMRPYAGMGTGCASIADSLGNLLFYSDGVFIWNKNHTYMLNGSGMGTNSSQGAIVVPKPGNPDLYYFFNIDKIPGYDFLHHFQYSLIDMTLDNGNGAVVSDQKSILLYDSCIADYSATYHANHEDIWVLSHKRYSDKLEA